MTTSLRLPRRHWLAVVLLAAAAPLGVIGAPSARAATPCEQADHIAVSVSPSTPAVGQDLTVKAVAKDASNHTCVASGYGLWNDNAGALAPVTPYTQVLFLNGVATFTAHLDKPLHNEVINVFFYLGDGKSRKFNVLGPLDHLTTSIPSGNKVGTPFNITLTARDAVNNLLTGYTGALSWNDSAGVLPSPSPFAGGVSKTSISLSSPVRSDRLTITTGGLSVTRSLNVIGPVTKLDLHAPTSVAPATPFKIVASARDAAGNVVPDYNASASWSDSAGSLTPSTPSAFLKGVSTTSAQFPAPVKSDVVTLTAGGLSAHRTVSAVGPFNHVEIAWTPASVAFDCSSATGSVVARAVDAAGNLVTSYNDPSPTWFLEGSGLPGDLTPAEPAPFVAGVSNNPSVAITPAYIRTLTLAVTTGKTWNGVAIRGV